MKKLMILVAAVLFAAPAFAQETNTSVSIYTSDNGVFSADLVSHLGWGFHFVKSEDFTPKGSGEFFLNVLNLKIYPVESFGIEAGLDCKWNYFGSKKQVFLQDDHLIQAYDFSTVISKGDKFRSDFSVFALSVPLVAKFKAGNFQIGGGAELNFNLGGKSFYRYEIDDVRYTQDAMKARVNNFTYDFMVLAGLKNLYLFGKFYPKSSVLLPEGSVRFNYWTLGFGLCL